MNAKVLAKLDKFFSEYQSLKIKKGQILVQPEIPPNGIFYLKEGVIKQYTISANGEELILNIYRPASLFPMGFVINKTIPVHYFEAMTEVLVGKAPAERVLEFIQQNTDVLFDLVSRIYYGLEGFFTRMEYLMTSSARNRLVVELLICGKRFGEKEKENTIVKLKLTEKDLAAQSGIARETVSREMQKLIKKGLITFSKNILNIKNLSELEKELLS